MNAVIIRGSKAILVGIVLVRLVFVFDFQDINLADKFSIELAEGETEGAEKPGVEVQYEGFPAVSVDLGFSSRTLLTSYYTHVPQGIEAHILEIVPPPPQG